MVKKLLTLAILCVALAIAAYAQQRPQASRTWALVVGISKYQKLPGGQQLQFADRDAALFSEAIQKLGVSAQNVKLLTGIDATAAAIKSALGNWLARSVLESDTVLIFFSGHGLFEREFGESYLLGYDSDPNDPYGTALSVSELGQALTRRVRSGRVLVIADAVRRDFFDPESDPDSSKSFGQAFDQLTAARPGLSAIIASGPGEFSREGQRWGGQGVFTKHLADVLFDGASRTGDLAVATEDLFELLRGRVGEDTSGKQRPWRSGKALTQGEVARTDPQKAPAAAPKRDFTPTATLPNAVASSRAADVNQRSDTRSQPDQKKDVAVNAPTTPGQPPAETKPLTPPSPTQRPGERSGVNERRPVAVAPPVNTTRKEPARVDESNKKPDPPPVVTRPERVDPGASVSGRNASGRPKPGGPPTNVASTREPSKVLSASDTTPPGTGTVKTPPSSAAPPVELARADIPASEAPARPKQPSNPPSAVAVSPDRAGAQPETLATSVPTVRAEAAPSPLVLQLEAAIASGTLIQPRDESAWDLYQRMLSEPSTASDAARLKPALAAALTARGRSIVAGDVRGDNISDKVDEFKQAGQMLARARTLTPDNGDISALERLSAAAALISLQFYDEAERALAPLQATKLAAVENALGLVYQGKLDTWRAERAFKRACEIDSKWAAPHYNLALLYRSQQNPAALAEFEAAASNDESNVNLLVALGDEYFTRQQWKQAGDAYSKAVGLNPSDDNLHTKLGHALYSQGLQVEANREYQRAQELRRQRP
ncbi:MAG TPA: caspase family protein [Blastocatellia bacterium]|nr:caspase family protein [Blastocatellia bacterium]